MNSRQRGGSSRYFPGLEPWTSADVESTLDMEAAIMLTSEAHAEAEEGDIDGVVPAFSRRRTLGEVLFAVPPPPKPVAVLSPIPEPVLSMADISPLTPRNAVGPNFSRQVQRVPDDVDWANVLEYLNLQGVESGFFTSSPRTTSFTGPVRFPNIGSTVSHSRKQNNCSAMNRPRKLSERNTRPWGITAHPHSPDIFVTDRATHEVLHYTYPTGIPILKSRFGKYGTGLGCFRRPSGIAVDAVNSRLVISDKDNHRINIYSLAGDFLSTFGRLGHADGQFRYPWGVAVSPNGKFIAVADSRNYRVQLFDGNGNYLRKYSVFETNPYEYKNEFYYPRGICFDNEGATIFVSDFNLHTIFALNLDLTQRTSLTPLGLLNRPQGLVVDRCGHVIVCDSRANAVRVLSPFGGVVTTINSSGSYQFEQPVDICTGYGGSVCLLDAAGRLRLLE